MHKRARGWIACAIVALWFSGCVFRLGSSTPPSPREEAWDDGIYDVAIEPEGIYRDGTYIGRERLPTPQFIVVDVTIEKSRIVAIRLRQHPAWKAPQEQDRLLRMVVTHQTTSAIAPRHEGSEQDQLLDAIDDALDKARQPAPEP
jgi:uncharacterized protein with FMN-binding domain